MNSHWPDSDAISIQKCSGPDLGHLSLDMLFLDITPAYSSVTSVLKFRIKICINRVPYCKSNLKFRDFSMIFAD